MSNEVPGAKNRLYNSKDINQCLISTVTFRRLRRRWLSRPPENATVTTGFQQEDLRERIERLRVMRIQRSLTKSNDDVLQVPRAMAYPDAKQ